MLDIDLVVGDELVEPETKRGDIVDQINGAFLEGDEHAGFVAFPSAMNEKRRGAQRLAATGRAAEQCGAPRSQAAQREIVTSPDPGWRSRDAVRCGHILGLSSGGFVTSPTEFFAVKARQTIL